MTRVRSADGFTTAFPALETLSLHGCRSFMDASQLSGLTRLTHLDLGWTGIRDLTGLRDVPAMTRLDLRSCSRLNDLAGIDAMSGLTELILQDCPRLETLRGLGPHPRLEQLEIENCSWLVDLSGMSPLTRLKRLTVRRCFGAYRVPALLAALVVSFGMSMNAMLLRNGFPGLPDQDPGWWTLLWMAPWAALSLLAAAWPPEASRPWPMFTRRCRAALTKALADESPETGFRVSRGAYPPRASQASTAGASVRRSPDEPTDRTGRGDPAQLANDTGDLDVDHDSGFVGGD
ncbi:leucine-rich repeat domain-containing protein [Streptomyces umbrinus]|uniref:leucine-rich repeat domain-containing protein n=1 Tax=Streptomyces umbrinus TaxID=67370 RepID=UPI0033D6B7D8